MSNPVIANPPAFPGTRPVTAPFFNIQNKYNIYADFQNDWARHVEWTVESKQLKGRAYAGVTGAADHAAADDFYRTNRYDIFSHYVRAFDAGQKLPLSRPEDITNPIGRELVRLLDQHISDTDALTIKTLQAKGVLNNLNATQVNFLRQDQAVERAVIPGETADDIVARRLLKLKLITTNKNAPEATSTNVGSNAAQLRAVAKAFDPVADVITNGVKIISIIANVHHQISRGQAPMNFKGDITKQNKEAYDNFGKTVAASPFYQSQVAANTATLMKAGLGPVGNAAQDIWNGHLVEVALLVAAESDFDAAVKAGTATPENPGSTGAAFARAAADVLAHAPLLAYLFSMSLGLRSDHGVLPYPHADKIVNSTSH